MHTLALGAARAIARELARTAIVHDDRCTWMGTTQNLAADGVSLTFRYGTLGPDVYGGTAGVALFLAEAWRVTGDPRVRRFARAAIRHALARASRLRAEGRLGFYDGAVGIAFAAAWVADRLSDAALAVEAQAVLSGLRADEGDAMGLDVLDGAAGAVPALIALAERFDAPELITTARHLGDRIVATAHRHPYGWSWAFAAQGGDALDLTGFSHGTAGMAWALSELHAATGDTRYAAAAAEAIRFESHWFRPDEDNWPDFRDHAGDPALAPCAHAWCHGAPGIGLARLAALERTPTAELRRDVRAAVRASMRWLDRPDADADFSPCHGRAGAAELLLEAGRRMGAAAAARTAARLATAGARRWGNEPAAWPCGVQRGSNPSLMIGLAGIGYFLLRVADPSVPSLLLPTLSVR